MFIHHPILVDIQHDLFDVINLLITVILGVTAIYSLWLSRKAFKRSEFDSAMNTSPSIVIRPKEIYASVRQKKEHAGAVVVNKGQVIKKNGEYYEIIFSIQFECFNAGRGVAFNISQPKVTGIVLADDVYNRTPLHLKIDDESFSMTTVLRGSFTDLYRDADKEISVEIFLTYTNDQNNILCKSIWKSKIKPFERSGTDLKVRDIRLLERSGKIEYSQIV